MFTRNLESPRLPIFILVLIQPRLVGQPKHLVLKGNIDTPLSCSAVRMTNG